MSVKPFDKQGDTPVCLCANEYNGRVLEQCTECSVKVKQPKQILPYAFSHSLHSDLGPHSSSSLVGDLSWGVQMSHFNYTISKRSSS